MERIEFIKSTQSTLLGKDTDLGVILLVTRKPGRAFTAEAVGSTAGAVRVAQHRALARLKSEIIATGHDYA